MTLSGVRFSVEHLALLALAAFVASIPSENGVTVAGVGSLSRLLGLIAFGVGLLSLVAGGRVRFRAPSLFLVLTALFSVWVAATYFWSIAPEVTVVRVNTMAQLAALVWLVHQLVRTEHDLDVAYQGFVLGCYVMVGVGIATFFGSDGGFRNVGGGFNANGFAIVSALGVPMAWSLATRRRHGWLTVVNALYPLWATVAVVLAASRGGLLTAIVALAIVPLLLGRLSPLRRLLLFVSLAAVTSAGALLLPTAFPELQRNIDRLAEVDEELLGGGTLTGRTDIWAAGLDVFAGSPIVGVGMGGFNTAVWPVFGRSRSPHNAFLSVAVGSGGIGLTLYVLLVVVALLGVVANPVRRVEHLVLFAALLVGMMPTNSDNDKFAWFILAALAAVRPVFVTVGWRPDVRRAPAPSPAPPATLRGSGPSSPQHRTTP